ncbi:hypothetical protein Tco_0223724 [Tanacetum coccineum]
MEDEFYHLTVKGNDLKTYVRRFQELAKLCPTMVPDSEKMMEVFIGGLPRSIEGNTLHLSVVIIATMWAHLTKTTETKGHHWKESATITLLVKPVRERALCKSVPKDHQQQCPGKSLYANG